MKRIIAQARKELTQVFRDRLTVALALVLPLILLGLFGKTISFSVTDIKVYEQDFDQTLLSRKYVETLRGSLTFEVEPMPLDMDVEEALKSEKARAVIIIPKNFERDLKRGIDAQVQWVMDATDVNTTNIMRGHSVSITEAFMAQNGIAQLKPPIKAEMRMWYNPGRDSEKHIGPGVIAVVLSLFPPLLAALATAREGQQKTILQVYVSSISAGEYVMGKIAAFFMISLAEWVLTVSLAFPLFGLHLAGDPTPLIVGTILYLFCNVCFGVMVGAAVPDQAAAIQVVAMVCFLLAFMLSGFMFPVSNIPLVVCWISAGVPARYYIEITRDAFVRGGGWATVWHAPLMLGLIGAFFFVIAWRKMRNMQVEV